MCSQANHCRSLFPSEEGGFSESLFVMQGSQELSLQRQQQELRLPETDADGLASYLHLLTQIFSTASVSDVESWISQLEASIKKQPLWAIFFQLMCHPVPQVESSHGA